MAVNSRYVLLPMNKAEKWSVFITYANGDPIEQKLEFIDGPEKARRRSVTFI